MFTVSQRWQETYPGACAGVLLMEGVANPPQHAELDRLKQSLEADIRARFAGRDRSAIRQDLVFQAYAAYYKRFDKTYHVQLQLESIAFQEKSIPKVAALVEAMFMAELNNGLLTAGHDLDSLSLPLTLDVSDGTECYTLMRGSPQVCKNGDMLIRDGQGVISSILYGPDQGSAIRADTQQVVFTVYVPAGIIEELVLNHLRDIEANVRLVAPDTQTKILSIYR